MSVDMLQQLGELPSKRMTDKQKVETIEVMLTNAERQHFEATVNGAWDPASLQKAKTLKGMIETLEKQLKTVQARIPKEEEKA